MKKVLSLIMALAVMLSLVACGGNGTPETTTTPAEPDVPSTTEMPATTEAPQEEVFNIGDTVSTDIVEFTLDSAALGIALHNGYKDTNGDIEESYLTVKEYSPDADSYNPYVANKGHALLACSYTIKNLDRALVSVNMASFSHTISVDYKGETIESSFNPGVFTIDKECLTMDSNGKIHTIPANKWIEDENGMMALEAGVTGSARAYLDIAIDFDKIDSDVILRLSLPNSSGKSEVFSFSIGK